jgi:hypothetical protein
MAAVSLHRRTCGLGARPIGPSRPVPYNSGRYFVRGSKTIILWREAMKLKLRGRADPADLPVHGNDRRRKIRFLCALSRHRRQLHRQCLSQPRGPDPGIPLSPDQGVQGRAAQELDDVTGSRRAVGSGHAGFGGIFLRAEPWSAAPRRPIPRSSSRPVFDALTQNSKGTADAVPFAFLVGRARLELATVGLRVHCSTS